MNITEREAWDEYVESVIDNPVGPTAKDIWQAACAWQREQVQERDAARYKWLRRQNVAEFKRLFVENIETGREFDDLVDELRMKRK